MNTVWSEHIQGIQTLYLSRSLRFDDMFFSRYEKAFDLDREAEIKVLEIGCGPGALAEALHRWYPHAHITALDRDSNFLAFCKQNSTDIHFVEGEAEHLPFADNSFDVTISNTVSEHIDPDSFWGEQYRVLRPGGICLCLSARKGLHCKAPCLAKTEEEKLFWEKVEQEDELEKYGVCRFPMTEAELPASMEQHGFTNVMTNYAVIDLTPDDPKYPAGMAETMIEAMRQNDLEAIASAHSTEDQSAIKAVNDKYDERIRLYREGIKQWDTSVSVTMIVRGIKN